MNEPWETCEVKPLGMLDNDGVEYDKSIWLMVVTKKKPDVMCKLNFDHSLLDIPSDKTTKAFVYINCKGFCKTPRDIAITKLASVDLIELT